MKFHFVNFRRDAVKTVDDFVGAVFDVIQDGFIHNLPRSRPSHDDTKDKYPLLRRRLLEIR